MPGIVGCITRQPKEFAQAEVRRMIDALLHEDFYVAGAFAEESQGVYAGWVARKGSFCEEMPLQNERRDVTLIFSGEEFPEPGVAGQLKQRGHELNPNGPEYLVHLYEEQPSFPAGLNGRFHGLLTDQARRSTVLFNDRYGMHRLYYYKSKDAFYFAAEAKAILAVRPELRELDAQSVGEFVSCSAVLENRTLFKNIYLLPPASAWIFRNGCLEREGSYFDPREWEEQEILDPENYYQQLQAVFARNVPRYFAGNERIGMSLTGGLDTRMVVANRKPDPGALPCYTFGSMFRENEDVRVARKVAKACGQQFEVLAAGEEFLRRFREYAERAVYLSDGSIDVSRSPDLYLNELAREIAPVRMTGNYGGEILRGVRAFKPTEPAPGIFTSDFLTHVRGAGETYASVVHGHPISFAAFRQAPWYQYGVLSLEQTQLSMRSPFLDNDFVRTAFRAPASELASDGPSLRLIADGDRRLSRFPTDRGLGGAQGRVAEMISRARLEFLFKAEYAYDMGMPQWLARMDHAISPLRAHRLFLGRHKPFHFRIWYRDTLAGYLQEMLLDTRSLSRPYIERRGVEAMVRDHVKGSRNYTTELHKVLTLELLHRLFLEKAEIAESPGATRFQKPFMALAGCA